MAPPKGHEGYPGCGRPRNYSEKEIEDFADELLAWSKVPTNIWFRDFCLERDLDPDWMSEWAKENEAFAHAYRMAKHWQESKVVNNGLTGIYNSTAMKFVLMNAHDWKDRSEQKVTGSAVNPLQLLLETIDGQSKQLVKEEGSPDESE